MKLKNALILNSSFNEIFYEIGGILYLFEQGYIPDVIISTSFSSITAGLLSKEPTVRGVREIIDFYKFIGNNELLNKSLFQKLLPIKSYYSYKNLEAKLRKFLPESFNLLKIPVYIISYDLNLNDFRIFGTKENDNVIKAIMSSISIPDIYKPYEFENGKYISSCIFPFKLVEFALELGVNNIIYFIGDYNKLSTIISKDYKLLLNQNYKEFTEEISELFSRILIYEIKTNKNLFDFSKLREKVDEGYKETRKKYIYYKLFRFGRVKETLDLLKRPDLSEEEKIIKAYAIYLEGDVPQAYTQFSQLYEKYPDNEIIITGYSNTLIDIGEIEQAGEILEGFKNRTKNPYFFDALSRYYFYRGEIDKSIENLKIAMNYAKNEPVAYNLALIHYAITMASIGRIREAIDSFTTAINNLEYLDNAYYLSFAYVNALNLYLSINKNQKVEEIANKLENYLELSGSSRIKFVYYLNYGFSKPQTVKDYIRKAINIAIEKGDQNLLSLGLSALADSYLISNEPEKAEIYSLEALETSRKNNLFYNLINSLIRAVSSKIFLEKYNEALSLFSILENEDELPIPNLLEILYLKIFIYDKTNQTENFEKTLKRAIEIIKEHKITNTQRLVNNIRERILEILAQNLDIDTIIELNDSLILSKKIKLNPKSKIEFLEKLKLEDSINYIEDIKSFSNDTSLKIYIDKFAEHWRNVCEQYISTFGDINYFFNNDVRPITIFGDELNLYILLFLILNRDKILTYGNISLTFGIHSENIKPRLKQILEIIEPWTISKTPKYLTIEDNRILFRTDENFKVDIYLFEDYLNRNELENAISLYDGDFVPSLTHPYFSEVRNKLKEKYLNAVYELAKNYISDKAYDKAIIILEKLLSRDILNLEHLKLLISTLYKIGRRAYAYEWYLRYLSVIDEPKFKFEEVVL